MEKGKGVFQNFKDLDSAREACWQQEKYYEE